MSHFHRALLLLALFLGLSSGCAMNRASVAMNEPQIERGRPNALVDGAGWVVGIPQKVMLWNSRVDNHNVSQRTEQMVKRSESIQFSRCRMIAGERVRLNQKHGRVSAGDKALQTEASDGRRHLRSSPECN